MGEYVTRGSLSETVGDLDRKSTRLNSSHGYISYAVFCLKKKIINSSPDSPVTSLLITTCSPRRNYAPIRGSCSTLLATAALITALRAMLTNLGDVHLTAP